MDGQWRDRERERFDTGHYKPVPWHAYDWWQRLITTGAPLAEHYAHVSRTDSSQIAFVENEQKGMRDRHTRMKPGRYLTRFCGEQLAHYYGSNGGKENAIRDWAAEWMNQNAPFELLFATDPDEIERVYTHGPESCMSHSAGQYESDGIHPARVYGAGDLAVAYIVRDRDGEQTITARAVVWPEKKIHTRLYGRDELVIGAALRDQGYSEGRFWGARLTRIEVGSNGFVCPYVDWHDRVIDNGGHLVIVQDQQAGEMTAQSTNGITLGSRVLCSHCETRCTREELTYYECLEASVCESCADSLLGQCDHCSQYVTGDSVNLVRLVSRTRPFTICDDCLENDFVRCHVCERYATSLGDDVNGNPVCATCIDEHYTLCQPCNEYHPDENVNDDAHCPNCAETFAAQNEAMETAAQLSAIRGGK